MDWHESKFDASGGIDKPKGLSPRLEDLSRRISTNLKVCRHEPAKIHGSMVAGYRKLEITFAGYFVLLPRFGLAEPA
jgi:hypothetical protein